MFKIINIINLRYEKYFLNFDKCNYCLLTNRYESSDSSDIDPADTVEEEEDFISDVDSKFNGYIDVDPCVSMLHDEISNGSLSREHIFYKYVLNASSFAQKISTPFAQFV